VTSPDSSILHEIATGEGAARAEEAKARTELLKQQAQAQALENQARLRQLQQQGAIPRRETRDEKADRQFHERIRQARAKHSDFDAVIDRDDFVPTPTMQKAIFRSRVAGELAYWLARHPEAFQRIAALPPTEAMRQIGKIEATLK
jgi:hypothetical protein